MAFIEIDGKKVEVRPGQMIIEAADELGIEIPRFCYHKKLSIAANCRMCLVDVANAPKPLPACATPITDGMKVSTKSPRAVDAQKAVMEFLLINHPLDCPICDQGGQCELQDVALEYGKDVSRYEEGKRVVKDKNIGPLISTEMTRCIQCTRCVRFGAEIAGVRELGATGRGEFMEIGTYVEKSVNSELSGNVIDLCPVGALTSKPFRFEARAWELKANPSVSMHDCVGSNLFFHTLRGKVIRALPKEKEALNEVWLSDRDRFSYEGLNHSDRLKAPLIKKNGEWVETDWLSALSFVAERLSPDEAEHIGVLASPNSTVEEFYLLQKLFRNLGCQHIDHRLRQMDYRHQEAAGSFPQLGISLADLESQESIILVGCDIHKEQPIIGHRIRKATLHGGHVYTIGAWQASHHFNVAQSWVGLQGDLITPLLEVIKALYDNFPNDKQSLVPSEVQFAITNLSPSQSALSAAKAILDTKKVSVLLGQFAVNHPEAATIYWLSRLIAKLTDATWGEISNGANSAGGALAGALPHRLPFGIKTAKAGLNALQMLEQPRETYFLLHCEPELDCANAAVAHQALMQAKTVIALTAFDSKEYREYADVLLPVTPISEMAGTYVNGLGEWQRFDAVASPLEQSRPAWKVLRVLGNLLHLPDFNYETIEEIGQELQNLANLSQLSQENLLTMPYPGNQAKERKGLVRLAFTSLYAVDGITRRADALQETLDAKMSRRVRLHSEDAKQLRVAQDQSVYVIENAQRSLPMAVEIDDAIPQGAALVCCGIRETQTLGAQMGTIEILACEGQ
ncbi:MAG: NADH-quinone oxidoreductase subunit NuoG [Candidatus Berkiella sp.]